jgi:hypothetical protein
MVGYKADGGVCGINLVLQKSFNWGEGGRGAYCITLALLYSPCPPP